jgi:hypothetical protein
MLLPLLMNLDMLDGSVVIPPASTRVESGAARYYPKKRKKPIEVVRWSDFETREKRAEALAQALATAAIPIKTYVEEEDMEELDDEILLKALTVILH